MDINLKIYAQWDEIQGVKSKRCIFIRKKKYLLWLFILQILAKLRYSCFRNRTFWFQQKYNFGCKIITCKYF